MFSNLSVVEQITYNIDESSSSSYYYYNYSAEGTLLSVKDSLGNFIKFDSNDDGQTTRKDISINNILSTIYYEYRLDTGLVVKEILDNLYDIEYNYVELNGSENLVNATIIIGSLKLSTQYGYNEIAPYTNSYRLDSVINISGEYFYEYDSCGNISKITRKIDSVIVREDIFSYDEIGQLINHIIKELVNDVLTVTLETLYDYDINGNILSISRNKLTGYYTELPSLIVYYYGDEWKDLLTSIEIDSDVFTLDYDNIGNVITIKNNGITVEEFEWNGRELVEYRDDDYIIEYSYNYQGIRVQKVIKDKSTQNIIKTINYVVDGSTILAEIYGNNDKIIYRYDNNDNVIGFNYNDIEYLYIKNLQNDIIGIMDLNGTILVTYEYDAYGNIINLTDNSTEGIGSINPFRYRSYYYDSDTRYYYLNSRYYNPKMSRFINLDVPEVLRATQREMLGANLFAYCLNNPIMFKDPSGNWVVSLGLEGGAAFILGLYLAVGVNFDGTYLSVTISLGLLIITNAAAYITGYFAYYPNKKSVNDINSWGVSVGASISIGLHGSFSGGFEMSTSGNGFSASLGAGVSIVPIPYFQTKFGYTWTVVKWNLFQTKNGTSTTKKIFWTKMVTVTKRASYTDVYIYRMKKTIRIYTNRKVMVL